VAILLVIPWKSAGQRSARAGEEIITLLGVPAASVHEQPTALDRSHRARGPDRSRRPLWPPQAKCRMQGRRGGGRYSIIDSQQAPCLSGAHSRPGSGAGHRGSVLERADAADGTGRPGREAAMNRDQALLTLRRFYLAPSSTRRSWRRSTPCAAGTVHLRSCSRPSPGSGSSCGCRSPDPDLRR
jgi:hypothetical protein